jgi:hypothetical protein
MTETDDTHAVQHDSSNRADVPRCCRPRLSATKGSERLF